MVSVALAKEAIADADVVALLVDASTGASDQDAAIGGEVDRAGRGIVIVANKWDLVKTADTGFVTPEAGLKRFGFAIYLIRAEAKRAGCSRR